MIRFAPFALALTFALASAPAAQVAPHPPAATRVVRFTPPSALPERTQRGECAGASFAADFRPDAVRCAAGSASYDPCFQTAHADRVLCDVDPRDPASGLVIALPSPIARAPHGSSGSGARAWFFELADGSTCQPLLGTRREIEGLIEIYTCRFGTTGDADAVLGDFDTSGPVWTIQKVLINKKIEPQTIKSATTAPVRAVWQ